MKEFPLHIKKKTVSQLGTRNFTWPPVEPLGPFSPRGPANPWKKKKQQLTFAYLYLQHNSFIVFPCTEPRSPITNRPMLTWSVIDYRWNQNVERMKNKNKKKRAHEARDTKKLLLHFDIIYDLLLYTDPRQHAIHSLYIKKTKFCLIASHLRVCTPMDHK